MDALLVGSDPVSVPDRIAVWIGFRAHAAVWIQPHRGLPSRHLRPRRFVVASQGLRIRYLRIPTAYPAADGLTIAEVAPDPLVPPVGSALDTAKDVAPYLLIHLRSL